MSFIPRTGLLHPAPTVAVLPFPAMPLRGHLVALLPRLAEIPGFEPWRPHAFIMAFVEPNDLTLRASARTALSFALDYAAAAGWHYVRPTCQWEALVACYGLVLEGVPLLAAEDLRRHWPDAAAHPRLLVALHRPVLERLNRRIRQAAAADGEASLTRPTVR